MENTNPTIDNSKLQETEVVVVLDRSGSMSSICDATVTGFNTFLKEQQNAEGKAFMTLVQFDDRYEIDYKSLPSEEVKPLIAHETFVPRGMTALFDAVGKTIEELTTDRDVVFVIITDGHENTSKTYTREAVFKMIETQTKDKGWKFLFLAANQDAIKSGASIGISASNSMTYSADTIGTASAFYSVTSNVSSYRKGKFAKSVSNSAVTQDDLTNLGATLNFTDDQRTESNK
jgi:hypothetical protein